jgi:magnesium chelatase family protein
MYRSRGLICPAAQGSEAAFAGEIEILAATNLLSLINHFKGSKILPPPKSLIADAPPLGPDMADIKGQKPPSAPFKVAATSRSRVPMRT